MELEVQMLINVRHLVAWVWRKSANDFVACFDVLIVIVVIELVKMLRAPEV